MESLPPTNCRVSIFSFIKYSHGRGTMCPKAVVRMMKQGVGKGYGTAVGAHPQNPGGGWGQCPLDKKKSRVTWSLHSPWQQGGGGEGSGIRGASDGER